MTQISREWATDQKPAPPPPPPTLTIQRAATKGIGRVPVGGRVSARRHLGPPPHPAAAAGDEQTFVAGFSRDATDLFELFDDGRLSWSATCRNETACSERAPVVFSQKFVFLVLFCPTLTRDTLL